MQPTADRRRLPDGTGFASQHQKTGLAGVLGIMEVPQRSPAHAENHWAVAFDQHRKGGFVVRSAESLQELPIAQLPAGLHCCNSADLPQNALK